MFCEQCGAEVNENDKFCARCGRSFTGEQLAKGTPQVPKMSDEERRKYKKKAWIALLGPIGVFVGSIVLWGIINLLGSAGLGHQEPTLLSVVGNVVVPLIFALCMLAFPIGVVFAIFFWIQSRG